MTHKFVAFADLHVSAKTLDRALETLRRVRMIATQQSAIVVFLGDFWDKRGVLAVKQLHAVLDEMDHWRDDGVHAFLIPGNHDQVVVDGRIHGLRVFDPFAHIHVVTEPLTFPDMGVAMLPWREDSQDQAELFATLDPSMRWTIFGHAEVRGSIANNGHASPGRVSLEQIHAAARACYLGHYHKRQKLGDRTWYLGSPFEMDFGERNQPHGIALITLDQIDPIWIDFDDMPKHHVIDLRAPITMPVIYPHDVVQVVGAKEQLRDPAVQQWIEQLPANDVRPVPVREDAGSAPPAITFSLHEAVHQYTGQRVDGADVDELVRTADAILYDVAPDRDVAPIGTVARILGVRGRDFMQLRGAFELNLDACKGPVLLQGKQGVGKTSLIDAITWCLYGVTSPRRAGADTASLRADEVIHDSAADCQVDVVVMVDGDAYTIRRTKRRSAGSKLHIEWPGTGAPDGIATDDNQQLVERIVGLNYALWRACVSLGQGAVANFLTGADKARKTLLASAHGLDVCEPARKKAADLAKSHFDAITKFDKQRHALEAVIAHIESQDFETEAKKWEADRKAKVQGIFETIDHCDAQIATFDEHLATRNAWVQRRDEFEDAEIELQRKVQAIKPSQQQGRLQAEIGALNAEIQMAQRDKALLQQEFTKIVAESQGKSSAPCPTCGQEWARDRVDHYVAALESRIRGKDTEIDSLHVRMSTRAMELEGIGASDSATAAHDALEKKIAIARDGLRKATEAIAALDKIAANRDVLIERRRVAQAALDELSEADNPWERRAAAVRADLVEKKAVLQQLVDAIANETVQRERALFWVEGFGQNGLPVIVLRSAIADLEQTTNEYLAKLTGGRLYVELSLADDTLDATFRKYDATTKQWNERRYEQLSGGERRCAELAFSPFGLSEMLFRRLRCRVPLLIVDELTTHLGADEKALACAILHDLDRETILVVDHDVMVQSEFDHVLALVSTEDGQRLEKIR